MINLRSDKKNLSRTYYLIHIKEIGSTYYNVYKKKDKIRKCAVTYKINRNFQNIPPLTVLSEFIRF